MLVIFLSIQKHLQETDSIKYSGCFIWKPFLQRVSCFLDNIHSKFLDYFILGEQICINVFTVKFKGWISFITYNKKKTDKMGCQSLYSSWFKYWLSVTTELLVRPDLPVPSRILVHLYSVVGENSWCLGAPHVHRPLLHQLCLGLRSSQTEMPYYQNDSNE